LIRARASSRATSGIFIERYEMLALAQSGAVFLLNAPHGPARSGIICPRGRKTRSSRSDQAARDRRREPSRASWDWGTDQHDHAGAFFALSGVLPREQAIAKIKEAIHKSYDKKGPEIVKRNVEAVDHAVARIHEVEIPASARSTRMRLPAVPALAPDFVKRVTAMIVAGAGDLLPVSAFPPDGTWPTGTAKWEKRNLAAEIPIWTRNFASSATSARWSALTPRSAPRSTTPQRSRARRSASDRRTSNRASTRD
jgi:pyruvate-ferredoxin/flavodoxin oxidoreductase